VFVHINQLAEPIQEGDKVTFEAETGPRGLSALNVKKNP
jgi:cold shock CspA family protein